MPVTQAWQGRWTVAPSSKPTSEANFRTRTTLEMATKVSLETSAPKGCNVIAATIEQDLSTRDSHPLMRESTFGRVVQE